MNKNNPVRIAAALAMGAAFATPFAFAQSAVTPEVREAQAAATVAAQDARQTAQDVDGAPAQPEARQVGWNDVDSDGNGTISREESAALPALAAAFEQADADGDGELTPDEYRAHAAATTGGGD